MYILLNKIIKVIFPISLILIISIASALAAENETIDATQTETSTTIQTATIVTTPGEFRLAPSVSLTSTKNFVEATDPAILTLSMINPSVNDINLIVDVILKAPSGVYVTATSFATSGSNQNIGHFTVRPGEENHITIQITSTELGEKAIESQVVYYPEGDKDDFHMLQQTMSVEVKEKSAVQKPTPIETETSNSGENEGFSLDIPGFSIFTGIMWILCITMLLRNRREI